MTDKHVISIQSHVVEGYVGNKSAVFPLNLLGYDVSPVNTVQLSNHTGYGYWKGSVAEAEELDLLEDGLRHNGLMKFSHCLTGYVGSPSFVARLPSFIRSLKEFNPDMIYVCDPVLGDNGKLYVPDAEISIYRDEIIKLADIIVPNQFELETLSGMPVTSIPDVVAACDKLHEEGVKTIIVSSMTVVEYPGKLSFFGSSVKESFLDSDLFNDEEKTAPYMRFMTMFDRIDRSFTGTGDVLSALLLAHITENPRNLPLACCRALSSVQAICKKTAEMHSEELQLIKSKASIESPPVNLQIMRIIGEI